MDDFLAGFNPNTDLWKRLKLSDLMDRIRWKHLAQAAIDTGKQNERGNIQFTVGVAGGQAHDSGKMALPDEFCTSMPSMLKNTHEYLNEFQICSDIARAIGIPCGAENYWNNGDPLREFHYERFLNNPDYFPGLVKNVWGMVSVTMVYLGEGKARPPKGHGVSPHTDNKNDPFNPNLMGVSNVFKLGNRWVRLCLVCAQRKSISDTKERVDFARHKAPLFERFLTNDCTEPYQRGTPKQFIEAFGSEGIYIIQAMNDSGDGVLIPGEVLSVSLQQRPNINKFEDHVSCGASLIQSLHGQRPLTLKEAVECCMLFGLCNNLDIPIYVFQKWVAEGMPDVVHTSSIVREYIKAVLCYWNGPQNSCMTRTQTSLNAIDLKEEDWVELLEALFGLVLEWMASNPYCGATPSQKEMWKMLDELHKVLEAQKGRKIGIGPMRKSDIIQLLVALRIIVCAELATICMPLENNKRGETKDMKLTCQKALGRHLCRCQAVMENCDCEHSRAHEPPSFCPTCGGIYAFSKPAQPGNPSFIVRYTPDALGGSSVQPVPVFAPAERNKGDRPPFLRQGSITLRTVAPDPVTGGKKRSRVAIPDKDAHTGRIRKLWIKRPYITPQELNKLRCIMFGPGSDPSRIIQTNNWATIFVQGLSSFAVRDSLRASGKKRPNEHWAEVRDYPFQPSNRTPEKATLKTQSTMEVAAAATVPSAESVDEYGYMIIPNNNPPQKTVMELCGSNYPPMEPNRKSARLNPPVASATSPTRSSDRMPIPTTTTQPVNAEPLLIVASSIPMSLRNTLRPTVPLTKHFHAHQMALQLLIATSKGPSGHPVDVTWPDAKSAYCPLVEWHKDAMRQPSYVSSSFQALSGQTYDFSNPAKLVASKIAFWLGGSVWTEHILGGERSPKLCFATKEFSRLHLALCFLLHCGDPPSYAHLARTLMQGLGMRQNESCVLQLFRKKKIPETSWVMATSFLLFAKARKLLFLHSCTHAMMVL